MSTAAGHPRAAILDELTSERTAAWDAAGELSRELLTRFGRAGLLCGSVATAYGGLGLTSADNGALTADVGRRCSSVRSLMTSQGIAATSIERFADETQRARWLGALNSGAIAAVALSETDAGSDLANIRTELTRDRDEVVVHGEKRWVTGAAYADVLLVLGRFGDGGGLVLVDADRSGVSISRVAAPLGCRAAGHAMVRLDGVRVPAGQLLSGVGLPVTLLGSVGLTYGRLSVAWGCLGMIRACLGAAAGHADRLRMDGTRLADHQLVLRHLAEMLVAEQTTAHACADASRARDERSPRQGLAAVLAKHVGARSAALAADAAGQVLASAAATADHVVARALRDARLMQVIEGTTEICQLLLAEEALTRWA